MTPPRFTRRTDWPPAARPVARELERLRAERAEVLDLTETNPTRCALGAPPSDWLADLARSEAAVYSPDARGRRATRAAVAATYGARGIAVDPDRIFLCSGTSEAYAFLFRLLVEPDGAVLVPRPSYPLLDCLADVCDVRLAAYPLYLDDAWWLDTAALTAALPGARALVVIQPGNPTGACLKGREREALRDAAAPLAIISDEVFLDFPIEPVEPLVSWAGEDRVLSFTLGGLSKSLGLPQMKLAWIVVNGPAAVADEACRRLELIADTFLSVSAPVQHAAEAWLPRRALVQDVIRVRLRANLATLRAAGLDVPRVEGGWCALVRLPGSRTDETWAVDLLREDGVLVDPGSYYGLPPRGFAVVSLLPPPTVVREAAARFAARLAAECG